MLFGTFFCKFSTILSSRVAIKVATEKRMKKPIVDTVSVAIANVSALNVQVVVALRISKLLNTLPVLYVHLF